MNEIVRKLASIQRINKLKKHPNADRLEIAEVLGWDVITQAGNYKEGDLCVWFEPDSFVPDLPVYEFLRKDGFRSTKNLGDGIRIRTKKLRGVVSQGLILPISEFADQLDGADWVGPDKAKAIVALMQEGDDVTEALHVQKYEHPIPANLMGRVRGNFPMFIPKTDEERYQNLTHRQINEHHGELFEITTKIDGSSMTVYLNEDRFGVCSRNWDLEEEEGNAFWDAARKFKLEDALRRVGANLAVQGELAGPGIQDNPAKLADKTFFIFNIYSIEDKRYLSPQERDQLIVEINREFSKAGDYITLQHVPVLEYNAPFPSKEEALAKAESLFFGLTPAEGIVYKSQSSDFSFKMISPSYLVANDG